MEEPYYSYISANASIFSLYKLTSLKAIKIYHGYVNGYVMLMDMLMVM